MPSPARDAVGQLLHADTDRDYDDRITCCDVGWLSHVHGGATASVHAERDHGNTANEVIKAQDKHLKDMVASGDSTHASALKEMQGRWKNPLSGMAWYRKAKHDFAALPED